MKAKKINEAALEQVAGGTVKEFDELLSAVSDNLIVRGAAKLDSHTPVANAYIARVIEKQLLNIGLEADTCIAGRKSDRSCLVCCDGDSVLNLDGLKLGHVAENEGELLSGYDIVIVARSAAIDADFSVLSRAFVSATQKLELRKKP